MNNSSRRGFLRTGLVTGTAVSLSSHMVRVRAAGQHDKSAGRPNIISILLDDYGLDGVGCYGSDSHNKPESDLEAATHLRQVRV
jgi:hypothetical protein